MDLPLCFCAGGRTACLYESYFGRPGVVLQGMTRPDQFIPLFEKTALLSSLIFMCVKWYLGRIHIESGNFLNYLLTFTDTYQIPHEYVELELTETILGSKNKAIMEFIIACKAERLRYGTGLFILQTCDSAGI